MNVGARVIRGEDIPSFSSPLRLLFFFSPFSKRLAATDRGSFRNARAITGSLNCARNTVCSLANVLFIWHCRLIAVVTDDNINICSGNILPSSYFVYVRGGGGEWGVGGIRGDISIAGYNSRIIRLD